MFLSSQSYRRALEAMAAQPLPFERLRGKTVLVTGACGLIGSTLLDFLYTLNRAQGLGMRLVALDLRREALEARFGGSLAQDGGLLVAQDVCAPLKLEERPDFVVHAASNAHPRAFAEDPVGTMLANILGTDILLNFCKDRPETRTLFLSSGEIYGRDDDPPPNGFCEAYAGRVESMQPRSCYPESKRAAETLCASYRAQYGLHTLVARCCHIFGPTITASNSRADAQFLRNALRKEDIVMKSEGAQVRSYCYVFDAALALLTILLSGEAGTAYNVANRRSVATIRTYAQTLADLAGVTLRFETPDAVERQGFSRVEKAVLDPAKLEGLGWRPLFDLESAMRHMLAVCRELEEV